MIQIGPIWTITFACLKQFCCMIVNSWSPLLCPLGRSVQGHFQKSLVVRPVLRRRHSTDSGTVFGMTLALTTFWAFCETLLTHTTYIQMNAIGGSKNTQNFQSSLKKLKIWIENQFWNQVWSLIPKLFSVFCVYHQKYHFLGTKRIDFRHFWVPKKWYFWC